MGLNNDQETVERLCENEAYVQTIKGARFRGIVVGWYYNPVMKHYGVIVVATNSSFAGSAHVYPVSQLEEVLP